MGASGDGSTGCDAARGFPIETWQNVFSERPWTTADHSSASAESPHHDKQVDTLASVDAENIVNKIKWGIDDQEVVDRYCPGYPQETVQQEGPHRGFSCRTNRQINRIERNLFHDGPPSNGRITGSSAELGVTESSARTDQPAGQYGALRILETQ